MTDGQVRKQVVSYWDWRAATYDSQPGQSDREGAWDRVWETCFPKSKAPARILDVGAGTGFCSLALARLGHHVTAADISSGMLSRLSEEAARLGVEVEKHLCDVADMRFEPDSFDGVVARNVLWTLEDPTEAIRSWVEMVECGGVVVISDGKWNTPRRVAGRLAEGDGAGLRFEAEYLPVRSKLPMYVGAEVEVVERIMSEAGVGYVVRLGHFFAEDPFGMPGSGFFVVAGRKAG